MKNMTIFKKTLSLLLVLTMCMSLPLSVFAETITETSDPVTTDNGDGTKTVTTTTKVTDTDGGKTTVVLTIEDKTNGTNTEGQVVDSTVTNTTTTITEGNTTQVIETEEGHETITTPGGKPAVDADLPDITLNLPTDGTVVDGTAQSTSEPKVEGDEKNGDDDTEYDYTSTQTIIDRTASGSAEIEDAVIEDVGSSDLTPIGPEEYDGKPDMIWTDTNASGLDLTILMPQAPEGYDYVITGYKELVATEKDEKVDNMSVGIKIKRDTIVFQRDEAGNLLTDEEGNYLVTYTRENALREFGAVDDRRFLLE